MSKANPEVSWEKILKLNGTIQGSCSKQLGGGGGGPEKQEEGEGKKVPEIQILLLMELNLLAPTGTL